MSSDDRFTLSPTETTQMAHAALGQPNAEESLIDLERFSRVVDRYPSYHIVRGEYLIALGRLDEARESLKCALKLSPNSARPAFLLESLYGSQQKPVEPEPKKASITKPLKKQGTLAALFGETDARVPQRIRTQAAEKTPNSNFDLGAIASLLSRERPLVRPTSEHPETTTPVAAKKSPAFVSETLAGILLGQGKLKEALESYEYLYTNDPDRADYYRERIEIIQKRMKSST